MKYPVYVGHKITGAPPEFLAEMERLIVLLENDGCEVLQYASKGGKPLLDVNVYDHDMSCIDRAELFVAVCDHASIGLGMELKHAYTTKKQLRVFVHEQQHLTQIVPDSLKSHGLDSPVVYQRIEDIVATVQVVRFGRYMSPKALRLARIR